MKPLPAFLKVSVIALFLQYQVPADNTVPVKIGLLITDSASVTARLGAELAIDKANRSGGFKGHPFRLVVRYLDGPWGTGSKQAVNLVFDEKVWGLIGSHDGRNAHLVEQVATKARVVFISAWSGDPTLTQAFVPWLFNSLPDYDRQAEAILNSVFAGGTKESYCVVCDNEYDSRSALKSLVRKSDEKNHARPMIIEWESEGMNATRITKEVFNNGSGTVVLLCQPAVTANLVEAFSQMKTAPRLFSIITSLNENKLSEQELMMLTSSLYIPYAQTDLKLTSAFRDEYLKKNGRHPGVVAAEAFDATNLLLEAIRSAGNDERENIQKALYSLNYKGVTGSLSFDGKGNLKGICSSSEPGKGLLSALIK